ncbi:MULTISPECIES: ACP S-malonyltransferase [Sorangium]|uniref:Malonyl CoA-acyl carrier protein transacylase n=1 Tax=Sorangium cellulosum (strain So ce56) TaxID=448385 RepID=A9GJ23_SORC5|nr:ACP S-malonyltransferase [Sorangium cellulosum]WET20147.1 EtnB [Sorangium cellulosum]CAN93345.1 malonyl CoA-acyl carrier protein transacylase [Sorangium cellulosum So ce56]
MKALLFPGQGAQDPAMCAGVVGHPRFAERYGVICDSTRTDVLRRIQEGDAGILDQNRFSSLMTVLVSAILLDMLRERDAATPEYFAGYSVGQWSAMYAAGMLTYEQTIEALVERARLMDECVDRRPGAMCAVIGLREAVLEQVLADLRSRGHLVFIANYNCVGQYSISGAVPAIELAEEELRAHRPKKIVRLPVSGAWHCPMLEDAQVRFAEVLAGVRFGPRAAPVLDNVTGDWLPDEPEALRDGLARHISHPVQWERGIKKLAALGCRRFVEVGYGNSLTKFGFFIDRQAEFSAFHGEGVACAG